MRIRGMLLSLLLAVQVALVGCSAQPATPEGAAAVAREFLQARSRGDAGAVAELLTDRAQQSITRLAVANYLSGEVLTFGEVGPAVERAPGWVQVTVHNLDLRRPEGVVRWPEVGLTLHYEGRRWRVGWVDPLTARALIAYQNSLFSEEFDLAEAISEIDPYHYRGPLEYHYAYRGLKRLREAELALQAAYELASPAQAPVVDDAMARFKLSLKRPDDAARYARSALDKAAPFTPFLYSYPWNADVQVVLGRALLAQGDKAGAAEAARQAAAADPTNATLAMLQHDLSSGAP